MSVKIYVEGGGKGRPRTDCRKGFQAFIERAGFSGRMPKIIACGSRKEAYDRFKISHSNNEIALLLVDSEKKVAKLNRPWQHLKISDRWEKPVGASDEQCHMMVQIMESWFLADKKALADYYGQGYREKVIPRYQNVERIAKGDVFDKLERATKDTSKGPYNKGSHSFKLLAKIDPDKVRRASRHANRFIEQLEDHLLP